MVSASDWTPMEPMRTDDDNHADLFGGDLFSDELLDIYNAAEDGQESSCPDEGVPLSNGMSQILEQSNDGAELNKDPNGNMGYGGLAELSSTPSMNDFTSILEGGSGSGSHSISITPSKVMDSILITKINNNSGGDGNVVAQSNGKKRAMADSPQSNPNVKKKATTAKTYNAADNSKGNTIATAGESQQLVVGNTVAEQNNAIGQSIVPVANISKDISSNKGEENNTPDPLTLQEQNALAMKIANSDQIKVEPATVQVPVLQQQPAQVPSSYQNQDILINTPKLVSAVPNTTNSPSSGASVSTVKTEESFKGVAQAAVNNLILSAGQNAARYESTKNDANGFVKAVDTTTTHVAALTSNNWVAACAASISDAPPGTAEAAQAAALAAASDPAAAKAARARRATLTADERARQNRDRNREHARNTRLRKKAYVEELKRTLTELVTARDASEIERRHEKQREIEVREVRYRVMEEFLKLRARGSEANLLARWVAILEDGFSLTIPKTDYRGTVHSQNFNMRQVSVSSVNGVTEINSDPNVQVLRGATECFDDASKVAVFLQTMSNGNVLQVYNCDRKKFMMDGINAMLEWTLTSSLNGDNNPSIFLKGCMRATFSPASNKLVCAELLFDTGSVANQIKSLVPYQDMQPNHPSAFSCIAETDALLDSVLPQQLQSTKQDVTLPCSVSVVSADKGDTSSDDEGLNQQQLQCKQEQLN